MPNWYINEEGEPYDYDGTPEEQAAEFPNDDHTPYATEAEAQAAAPSGPLQGRSYVVGLPVIVTVWDDGTVDYEIDKSEVTSAMHEDEQAWQDYGEAQVRADVDAIDKSLGF